MTDAIPPCQSEDIGFVLTQIGRLCEAIKAEFDLVGVRMTWLVTSEAFLFAAFATCVMNLKGKDHALPTTIRLLIGMLPILGMIIALLVHIAIRAAHRATERLKADREALMGALPAHLRISLISSRDPEHSAGNLPAKNIPMLIVVVWLLILLSLPMPPW